MKTPNPDVDPFVEALRGDLPSAADEARVRARLLAAGVALTGAALSTSSAAASQVAATNVFPGAVGSGAAASGSAITGSAMPASAVAGLGAGGAGSSLAAGAPAAVVKVGLLSKVLVLPMAAKVGVATTLALAVAAGSVPLVLERDEASTEVRSARSEPAAAAADDRRAQPPAVRELAPAPQSPAVQSAAVQGPAVPSDGAALATRGPATTAAPKLARATPANRVEIDGTETNGAPLRRRARAIAPAPSREVNDAAATRSPGGGISASEAAAAPVARDDSEGGRTELVRASSLGEETRLMEQAMVALGEGDHELARRSLEEHARRFPGGLLQRERERALARLRQADAERAAGSPR